MAADALRVHARVAVIAVTAAREHDQRVCQLATCDGWRSEKSVLLYLCLCSKGQGGKGEEGRRDVLLL